MARRSGSACIPLRPTRSGLSLELTLKTFDGCKLEAELTVPDDPRAAFVLCHPHPQHGGSMRSIVTSSLYTALPRKHIACLRFNFRGVGKSTGSYANGAKERLDAAAALLALRKEIPEPVPIIMSGWSFGGAVALSLVDDRIAGWAVVAPSFQYVINAKEVGEDPRPKLIILAEKDRTVDNNETKKGTESWDNLRTEVVPGADHYFVGRTDRVVELLLELVELVTPS